MIRQSTTSDAEGFLPAVEAARLLGIKRPTLYAYASRGLVRSVPGPGPRARLYARADLERLKARSFARSGHGPVAGGALNWGEPVLDTAISAIGPEGPSYRGRSAAELVRAGTSFEEVAELLWSGGAGGGPWPRVEWPLGPPARWAGLLAKGAPPLLGPALLLPAFAAADSGRLGGAPDVELARARRLLRLFAASFALAEGPRPLFRALAEPDLARAFLRALGGSGWGARELDGALVLCADHELNASTFAARIAASAGADLYACLSAALATLSGPRHGGVSDRVEALLDEVGTETRAGEVVRERLQRGDSLPGFGHRLYPRGDPRGALLLAMARRLGAARPRVRLLFALERAVRALGGEAPSLDAGLVALTSALGLRRGSAVAVFAMGRAAGWIAHVLEQRADPNLLRPRARYVPPPSSR